jgi:hypothetical protein
MERQVTVGEMLNATKTETLANGCVQKVRGGVHVVVLLISQLNF